MKIIAELYSEEIVKEFGENFLPHELIVVKNVRGIVKKEDGQVALAYYGKMDFHALIGGGVEKGEAVEDAIVREVKEETGFDSKIIDEVGCIFEFRKDREGNNSLIISYCYKLETIGVQGKLQITEHEKEIRFGLRWLSETEALKTLQEDLVSTEKKGKKRERDYLFLSHA
ncbi:MAG: NUDIX domain-containing protein [Candidatus Dojkabacteria bacterium]